MATITDADTLMSLRVSRFDTGPWPPMKGWRRVAAAVLGNILPRANPDLEPAYQRVQYWWLEIGDDGTVNRELAFDASGRPIAASPLGSNHGIFTDLGKAPAPLGADVETSAFEQVWDQVQARFDPKKPGAGLL